MAQLILCVIPDLGEQSCRIWYLAWTRASPAGERWNEQIEILRKQELPIEAGLRIIYEKDCPCSLENYERPKMLPILAMILGAIVGIYPKSNSKMAPFA